MRLNTIENQKELFIILIILDLKRPDVPSVYIFPANRTLTFNDYVLVIGTRIRFGLHF